VDFEVLSDSLTTFECRNPQLPEWNLFIDALSVYKSIHGDVLVPAKFVVPRSGEWSKACWELPLGSMVQRIRFRHDYLTGDNSYERRLQLGETRPNW